MFINEMVGLDDDFKKIAEPIITTENYIKQRALIQHGKISVYAHQLDVAYRCYKYAKKHPSLKMKELVRAALLHDYFLYDWHDKKKFPRKGLHGFTHPKSSALNAIRDYDITPFEAKLIRSHMFPLTLFHIPTSKEAWVLTIMDKKCALIETFKKKH